MATAGWKHDIGSWQSRKSLAFRQQQQQQQQSFSTTSMARGDHNEASNQRHGFLSQRLHKRSHGVVTFGSDFILPSSHLSSSPLPAAAAFMDAPSDVSLSALSEDLVPHERAATQVFDESVVSMRNSLADATADDGRMSWVTVFGAAPALILDVRNALEERCGATVTHHWPATGATCNWFYVEFEEHFDASRAVSLSPLTLCLGAKAGNLTVGIEWCHDSTFVRARVSKEREVDMQQNSVISRDSDTSFSALNASRMSGVALWTSEGRSFIQDASMRAAVEGRNRSAPKRRKFLASALKGSISIIDAVVGTQRIQFLPMFFLNRRQSPEQRLERLVALSNKKHKHLVPPQLLGATTTTLDATRYSIVVPMTSPWALWVNISTLLWLCLLVGWWWWRYQTVAFTV
jgi:hypothetical protein